MTQPDLFGHEPPEKYPDTPGHRGVSTQIAAAEKIKPCTSRLHEMILGYLELGGATRQEIADGLDLRLQTVCGRVRELVLAGQIKDTDIVRNGRRVVQIP